jgi:hypothetical protein
MAPDRSRSRFRLPPAPRWGHVRTGRVWREDDFHPHPQGPGDASECPKRNVLARLDPSDILDCCIEPLGKFLRGDSQVLSQSCEPTRDARGEGTGILGGRHPPA